MADQDPPLAGRKVAIATPLGEGRYRVDIALQGPRETVFFDV